MSKAMSWPPKGDVYMDESYGLVYAEGASHMDGLPEELSEIFDPHWGKFPPQHPMVRHVACIVYWFLFFVSLLGNGSVIYIFIKTKSLRTPSNMFVVNLAVSDLCMMTTMGLPVAINVMFLERYWSFGILACQIYGCLGAVFGTCSIMTMVVIGYDRYNVIVKGFSGVKIGPGLATLLLIALWVYSVGSCIPPFFGWGSYAAEGLLLTCSYDYIKQDWNRKSFMTSAFFTNYFFPLILISFFYVKIVKAVVVHEAVLKAQAKKMNVETLRAKSSAGEGAEIKIAKVAITNVLLWAAAWTPYAVVALIGCYGNQDLVTPLVSQLPVFLAKVASALNPLVYALSHPKYREAMAKEFPFINLGDGKQWRDDKTIKENVST